MQITSQRARVRHFFFLGAYQLRQHRRQGPVDMLPRAVVRVPEMARDGGRRPDV